MSEITPGQMRAARALIGWSQGDLATKSEIAQKTIADFELGNTSPRDQTLTKLRATLERAGIEFIDENGGGPGVRLRRRVKRK